MVGVSGIGVIVGVAVGVDVGEPGAGVGLAVEVGVAVGVGVAVAVAVGPAVTEKLAIGLLETLQPAEDTSVITSWAWYDPTVVGCQATVCVMAAPSAVALN